jgi:hypothetical protein
MTAILRDIAETLKTEIVTIDVSIPSPSSPHLPGSTLDTNDSDSTSQEEAVESDTQPRILNVVLQDESRLPLMSSTTVPPATGLVNDPQDNSTCSSADSLYESGQFKTSKEQYDAVGEPDMTPVQPQSLLRNGRYLNCDSLTVILTKFSMAYLALCGLQLALWLV